MADNNIQENYDGSFPQTNSANEAGNGANIGAPIGITMTGPNDDDKKIFVGGLTLDTLEDKLRDYFSQFGEIANINLKTDPITGESRRFAFITFVDTLAVDVVNAAGGMHHINAKRVDVRPAIPRLQAGSSPRGGRGGNRGGGAGAGNMYGGRGYAYPPFGQSTFPPSDGGFGNGPSGS